MLQIEDLSYVYSSDNENHAINNLSFKVSDGTILGVIGKSGSGKSTLAKLVGGIIKPSKGRIMVNGENILNMKDLYSKVGIVLQNPEEQLFANSVYEDISFGPKNQGKSDSEIKKIISNISNILKIDDLTLKKSPFELSGGNKRKCAIAGVMASDPQIIIMDEPLAGLDPKNRLLLLNFIKSYQSKTHKIIIIISNNTDDIFKISDEVLVLDNGKKTVHEKTKKLFSTCHELEKIGFRKPQIKEIVDIINQKQAFLNTDIFRVDDATIEIMRKVKHSRGISTEQ